MSRTLTLRKSKSRPVAYADATKDWAAPKVETAKDWAAPKVETGVDKVKTDVLPVVAGAVTAALAASEPVRTEAASRGSAALAALKGEIEAPKPKKHRIRKLFVLATVLGAAYAGWKAWAAQQQSTDPVSPWTTDSTTSMSTVSPVRPATDDPGGPPGGLGARGRLRPVGHGADGDRVQSRRPGDRPGTTHGAEQRGGQQQGRRPTAGGQRLEQTSRDGRHRTPTGGLRARQTGPTVHRGRRRSVTRALDVRRSEVRAVRRTTS